MHSIIHVDFHTADRKKSGEFFSNLFGWQHLYDDDASNYSGLQTGNIAIGLDSGGNHPPKTTTFYIASDDVEADLAKAEANGAKIVMQKYMLPNGESSIGQFVDPAGNVIGLLHLVAPETPKAGRPIVWTELAANDPEQSAKFYQDLFDWKHSYMEAPYDYHSFMAGEIGGGFSKIDNQLYSANDTVIFIASEDVEADQTAITNAGGTVEGDVIDIPQIGRMLFWRDLDENRFALFQDISES